MQQITMHKQWKGNIYIAFKDDQLVKEVITYLEDLTSAQLPDNSFTEASLKRIKLRIELIYKNKKNFFETAVKIAKAGPNSKPMGFEEIELSQKEKDLIGNFLKTRKYLELEDYPLCDVGSRLSLDFYVYALKNRLPVTNVILLDLNSVLPP